MTDIVVTARPDRPDNELSIIVPSGEITGWEEVEVSLRADAFPNSFTIAASSRDPKSRAAIGVKAGDPCTVLLGRDVVITGYVDREIEAGDKGSHSIQLVGRGKTQDLVDCSAEWPTGQLLNGDALTIAGKLAEPYGIIVELAEGAKAGPTVPGWLLDIGETGAAIIQRLARNAGLMAYETASGELALAAVGTAVAASGIVYGVNVERWSAENGMDQRYSDYVCSYSATDFAADTNGPGDIFYHREKDPNVPRHRQLDFVMEPVASTPEPGDFTIMRARWESSRRAGASSVVRATVDSWRDAKGRLWLPNTRVQVDVPGNRGGSEMVIAEAVFRRSDGGTTADLTMMPPAAFVPEPLILQPVPAEVTGPAA